MNGRDDDDDDVFVDIIDPPPPLMPLYINLLLVLLLVGDDRNKCGDDDDEKLLVLLLLLLGLDAGALHVWDDTIVLLCSLVSLSLRRFLCSLFFLADQGIKAVGPDYRS